MKAWLGPQIRPAFDFLGAFFTIAIKEGSSEIVHIDWSDDPNSITWVWAVGDWVGAEFRAPQLGIEIDILPGKLFGVMARTIAHLAAPKISGRRLVFTCFTDAQVLNHTTHLPGVHVIS